MKTANNFILIVFFTISSFIAQAQTAASTALTNMGIIEMHKSGLSTEIILSSIETSVCKFNLSSTGLVALKKAGIDDAVIKYMIDKQANKGGSPTISSTSSTDKKNTGNSLKAEKGISIPLLNHVFYSSSPTVAKPLEKSVAGIRTKQGIVTASVLYQLEGGKSTLRLSKEESSSFLINTGSDVLPELVLYTLQPAKDKREVITMKASPTGMKTGQSVITIDITRTGNGIYKITPGKKLESGEYCFTGKPSQGSISAEAFAFGID